MNGRSGVAPWRRDLPALLIATFLLQSCGGGGNGDGDGGSGNSGRVTFSTKNVQASASPGDAPPVSIVTISISGDAPPTVYYALDHSQNGLDLVLFEQTAPSSGEFSLRFRNPGSLANGSYEDTLELRICADDLCRTDLRGSPAIIRTTYTVSGEGSASGTISPADIELTVDQRDGSILRRDVIVTLDELPDSGVYIDETHTENAVNHLAWGATGQVTDILIDFQAGDELALGTYHDTVEIKVCYDQNCVRQVKGSPFQVATTVHVTLGVEPGVTPLEIASSTSLDHDIVDVELSRSLNAIVMVGTKPVNALYLYDIATGVETSQALALRPTAVSVSPDGQTAAVGHDAFVSVIDLAQVGSPAPPAPTILNLSTVVFDIALDDAGNVHAVPRYEDGDNIHSVDVATNTETLTPGFVEMIALHPSGDYLYGLPDSPVGTFSKWDVTSGAPTFLYESPFDTGLYLCYRFWYSDSGNRIYSACGEVFRTSTDPDQDFIHVGTIPITAPVGYLDNYIHALSHSAANNELAIVEWDDDRCTLGAWGPCYTRLAYVDNASLTRTALYGIGAHLIAGTPYAQRGRYVFHDGLSTRRILISELEEPPSQDQRYWINVIE